MTKAKTTVQIAEMATLAVSLILIAAVVVFLIREMLQKPDQFNEVRVMPLIEKTVKRGSLFVLPVEIENLGQMTLSNVAIRAEAQAPGETPHDFSLDYLGAKAKETVFVFLESDPRGAVIKIKPLHYQSE